MFRAYASCIQEIHKDTSKSSKLILSNFADDEKARYNVSLYRKTNHHFTKVGANHNLSSPTLSALYRKTDIEYIPVEAQ